MLLGISKRGDFYLRTVLIHGGQAVLWAALRRSAAMDRWMQELLKRRNPADRIQRFKSRIVVTGRGIVLT